MLFFLECNYELDDVVQMFDSCGVGKFACMLGFVICTAMTAQELQSSVTQWIIIKFLSNEGVKPPEILTRLRTQFGDSTQSQNRQYTWTREFKSGREHVENESHRCPSTSLTDDYIGAIREIIDHNLWTSSIGYR